MKILIYGAGVLGSLYAVRLAEAGYDVTVLARSQRLADLRVHGIVLEDAHTGQLSAYDAPELMPHICAFDDWMFETLPPTIAWERTTTLGRGGERCDFCWRRVGSPERTRASQRQGAEVTQ